MKAYALPPVLGCAALLAAAAPAPDDACVDGAGPSGRAPCRGVADDSPARPAPRDADLRVRTKPRLALAAAENEGGRRRVVVVGAGYAGWGAAHRLVEGGLRREDVTIVEADGEYGGRTRRDEDFAPFPLDLGASYIHGSFREELADLAGVRVDELPLARVSHYGWYLWREPTTYYGFLSDHIVSTLVGYCESSSECKEQAERLGIDKFASGDYSYTNAYGCFSKNDRAYWGQGGTDEQRKASLGGIKQRIHCGVNTQYQCQVTSVDYRQANNVETICEDGRSFVSNQVIVTVPLSVLKDGDIDFRPALPQSIQRNVERRGWGGGFKVFIEFETSFRPYDWVCFPSDGDCYDYNDDDLLVGEQLFWDHVTPAAPDYEGQRTLVAGYVTGRLAEDFAGMSESDVIEKILRDHANYYYWNGRFHRGYQPGAYKRHLLLDWSDPDVKPFVRGTYSISPWQGYEGRRADSRDRIFLAGEAFPAPLDDEDDEYEDPGWVYTAMHSGQRAAELILDLPPLPPATPEPSPKPTPSPTTPEPSPRPTPRPTPSNCANDIEWGFINRKGKRLDCSWVSRKPTDRRCRKEGIDGRKAKEACPKACETACQSASND